VPSLNTVLLLLLQKLGYSVHEVKAVPLDGPGSLAGLERCCEGQQARQQAQVSVGCSGGGQQLSDMTCPASAEGPTAGGDQQLSHMKHAGSVGGPTAGGDQQLSHVKHAASVGGPTAGGDQQLSHMKHAASVGGPTAGALNSAAFVWLVVLLHQYKDAVHHSTYCHCHPYLYWSRPCLLLLI
jgi:hypothetical protein